MANFRPEIRDFDSFKRVALPLLEDDQFLLEEIREHGIILRYAYQRLLESQEGEEIDILDVGNPYVINAECLLEDIIDDKGKSFNLRLRASLYQFILGIEEDKWKVPSSWPIDFMKVIIHGDYSRKGIGWADRSIFNEIKWNCEKKI